MIAPHLVYLLLLALVARPATPADTGGMLVVKVEPGYEGARAGLRPGDVLLEWQQGGERGPLDSVFDVTYARFERIPRGAVRLSGLREGQPLEVTLTGGEWQAPMVSRMTPEESAIIREASALLQRERDPARDVPALRELVERAHRLPRIPQRAVIVGELARAYALLSQWDDMTATLAEARRRAHEAGESLGEIYLWTVQVEILDRFGRSADAAEAQRQLIATCRRQGPLGLGAATALMQLAAMAAEGAVERGEGKAAAQEAVAIAERVHPAGAVLAQALEQLASFLPTPQEQVACLERALAIRDQWPDSLGTVSVLDGLGQRIYLDQPQQWLAYSRRAAALEERFEPDTVGHAIALAGLSASLIYSGDLDEAEPIERRALAIRERLMPDSPHVADSLDRLGSIAMLRGNYVEAEVHFRRAVAINERDMPGSIPLAKKLQSLGQLTRLLRDPAGAEVHLKRALAIFETSRVGPLIATCLTVLASVAEEQGDDKDAEAHFRRAIEIVRSHAPQSPLLSGIQQNLGILLAKRGRTSEAEALYREALARDERSGEHGQGLAGRHHSLGDLLLDRGDVDGAERHLRAALAIHERVNPGTTEEANACRLLAVAAEKRGRKEEALSLFQRATLALDAQSRRVVRSAEARARFRARNVHAYRELEDVLVDLGRPEEALHATERARAWTLLAQMGERQIASGPQVPADLEREKRAADAEYDRWLVRAASQPEAGTEVRQGLETARRHRDDVRARIRAAAPRAATFKDPVPLDLAGIRRVLDPGTLLLSYRLGADSSRVYAVGPGPEDFAALAIHGGAEVIRDEVRAFRERIESRRTPMLQAALRQQSKGLSDRLLAPVAARVAKAERLLIVPDGVLHLLPFAALADPGAGDAHRFLVEAVPLHVVSSMTLYETLARPRDTRPGPDIEIAGVGDPVYPGTNAAVPPEVQRPVKRGLRLEPLPWARRELEALREISPRGTTLWLGDAATEARAKSLGEGPRIVHFACHGFVDEEFPLDSGLALSIPAAPKAGEDNGLLQAWEVFESVRLDADLVTLSACRTGIGKEMAGEGLLGLTWAFQYAGARSVLASLWEVSDASTAELMRRFYRTLGGGASKAEALRQAQIDMLRRPATSPPYFWAAFQLIGDGH